MRLSDLFPSNPPGEDPFIAGITEDSRKVEPGHLFVAIEGTSLDGHRYIDHAVARGAAAIVVERLAAAGAARGVPVIVVPSSRVALAESAARFYGHPARELELVGFTGTFGKTTTSEILRVLLEAGGRRVGVLGSLGARYGPLDDPGSGLTTPAPVELHRSLRALRDAGADTVVIEATTHGLRLGRLIGLTFGGGLVAAVQPGEHTDFHGSFEDYVEAKRLLTHYLFAGAVMAYDADSPAAASIATGAAVASRIGISVAGSGAPPEVEPIVDIVLDAAGAGFTAFGGRRRSTLLGRPNVTNGALALAFAVAAGVPADVAGEALWRLTPLRRRLERFEIAGRTVLDDTAAHPDSLRATFEVADLLPRDRVIVAAAVRGSRGAEINQRNAAALAALLSARDQAELVVTAAADVAGPSDRVMPDEIHAVRSVLKENRCTFDWHDELGGAMRHVAARSRPGNLILLVGAQGMNEGARLLRQSLGC
jgi:UDP-N-acetylmuramoyl-L-alanyl-D-glutamate--2,6-diaminopimelate ligase